MVAPDAVGPGAGAIGGGTIVLLSVHAKLPYGLMLGVAGDADALGAWEPELAYRLTWTEGHIWTGRVELPPGTAEVNYKLVTMHKKGFDEWEDAPDRALHLADAPPVVTLSGVYGGELKTNASFEESSAAAAAAAAAAPGAVRMPRPAPAPHPGRRILPPGRNRNRNRRAPGRPAGDRAGLRRGVRSTGSSPLADPSAADARVFRNRRVGT